MAPLASILLPLYIYPFLPAWSKIASSIASNPDVNFTVIVNPISGPGAALFPNSDYAAGITQLRGYGNTELLGYVHMKWGHAELGEVEGNITRYAGWKEYEGADVHSMLCFSLSLSQMWMFAVQHIDAD